jgi:hypothetical protein
MVRKMVSRCAKWTSPQFCPEIDLSVMGKEAFKGKNDYAEAVVEMSYTYGLRTAPQPLHLIGSYERVPGIFSILFNGVYLQKATKRRRVRQ